MWRAERRRAATAVHAAVLAACVIAAVPALAQPSTEGLEPARAWVVEAGAGFEALTHVDDSFDDSGVRRALAARVGVRRRFGGTPVAVRLDAWGLQRRTEHVGGSAPPGQPDVAVRRTDRLLALALGVDLDVRLGERVHLEPMVGAGLVPWARGTTNAHPERWPYPSATETGQLLAAGLSVRLGRVVLAQHALILLGADRAVPQSREFFPLTVGWRF